MKIKYDQDIRPQIALAVLAVQEAGCVLNDVLAHRVWFTFDGKKGNICIQCSKEDWIITWDFCTEAPLLKTYEELLNQINKELSEFKKRQNYNKKIHLTQNA